MILLPGDVDACSFNDDPSPDTRITSGAKVSVSAQVIRELPLNWYFDLLLTRGASSGELKSTIVWLNFCERPISEQNWIWKGLSKVRIHIVDPRHYQDSTDHILRSTMNRHDAPELFRQWAQERKPFVKPLLDALRRHTAEQIVEDSAAGRAHSLASYLSDNLFGDSQRDSVLDISTFGNDTKPLIRHATQWAAKSAATFHEAVDAFYDLDGELEHYRYFPNDLIRRKMQARILDRHAFDKGDAQQIERLEDARTKILGVLRQYEAVNLAVAQRHIQIESSGSYLVQAADIAAGFASKLLEIEGPVRVATSFEYVTYNGRRLSQADAEAEEKRRWK